MRIVRKMRCMYTVYFEWLSVKLPSQAQFSMTGVDQYIGLFLYSSPIEKEANVLVYDMGWRNQYLLLPNVTF